MRSPRLFGGWQRRDRLDALLDAHGVGLHAMLLKLTLNRDVAADLLQSLFARLAASPGFAAAREPAAYAFRAAIRLAIDRRRRRPRDVARGGDGLHEPADASATSPVDALVCGKEVARLVAALEALTDLTREAICLRYLAGESYDAVAAALDRTPHQARGLCADDLRQLRRMMIETEGDHDAKR